MLQTPDNYRWVPDVQDVSPRYVMFTLDSSREPALVAWVMSEGEARLEATSRLPPGTPLMLLKLHEYTTLRAQIYRGLRSLGLTEAEARQRTRPFLQCLADMGERTLRGLLLAEANKPMQQPIKKRKQRKKGRR